jgi:hypothetical protein
MESVRVSMHTARGSLLSVSDVLAAFPANDLLWVIYEFFGAGRAPNGMSMPDFENRVRLAPDGLRMTWTELKAFGADVVQAFDCEIAAFSATDQPLRRRSGSVAITNIRALDSTVWEVAVDERVEEFQSVLSAIQRIASEA